MPLPINLRVAERQITITFNTTADILRRVQVSDGMGGQTDTYGVVATLPCTFARGGAMPRERENTYTVQVISTWVFVFAARTDIRTTDRIVCQGRLFEVVSGGYGSYEIATRPVCIEIV